MKATNKYHGQRLKEQDVLQLYAQGERNFGEAILSGCNFRRANLSEADFSGADICGTSFVEATLQRTNFCHAKGGTHRLWWMVTRSAPYIIGVLCGILQGFFSLLIGQFLGYSSSLTTSWVDLDIGVPERLMAAAAALAIVLPILLAIKYQGFTIKALKSATIAVVGVSVIATFIGDMAVSGVIAGLIAGIVTITITLVGLMVSAKANAGPFSITFLLIAFVVASIGVASSGYNASLASVLLSFYLFRDLHKHIRQGDSKFENLHTIGITFSSLGKTSFSGADLTSARFTRDITQSANFANSRQRSTNSVNVSWH